MMAHSVETKVDALVAVLDEDIQHAETTVELLDALRRLLIKRDDAGLELLLRDLRNRAQSYGGIEERRQRRRQELAEALGYNVSEMTLSVLRRRLSGPRRAAVADRQMQLRLWLGRLKREYVLTQRLVADCARFNRSLMDVFFGVDNRSRTTYGATGAVKHQAGMGMVSLQL
jgi:hypothetical protein